MAANGNGHANGTDALASAMSYVREDVRNMKAYTPGEQINNCIKLNTNECAWGPSEAVLKALAATTPDHLRLYPSPLCDRVRQAASDVFGVQPAQVLVGNGSDDCLTVVMRSFSSPGDTVACAWPTYSLYDTLATIQGVSIKHVDWLAEPDAALGGGSSGVPGWHLPISGLLETGARVVFIANPNNPSATLVPLAALELLASKLQGILVVDEAYLDYAHDGDGMSASYISKLASYPNVLVLRTFSKSYAMAGARLGLMFAHEALIDHMNKVKDSYNVNALTQIAGEAALRDRAHFSWLVKETLEQRKLLEAACASFGWTWPKSDANFLLVDVGSAPLAAALYARLKENGILVRYWGARPELCSKLRITVGAKEAQQKFFSILTDAMQTLPEAKK